jgi:hypothetical protein
MGAKPVWHQGVRDIHDRYFHESWEERVNAINQRYGLADDHLLLTHGSGVPMPWFNGDIESIKPGKWVLVISLNHQIDRDGPEMLSDQASGSSPEDAWWHQRRKMNSERWYGQFFGPLARVAATALEEKVAREDESAFATNRMVFVEICPYVSKKFALGWPIVAELLRSDLGFQLAAQVNGLLVQEGKPALVMVNGSSAISMFEHLYGDDLHWLEIRHDSCDAPREGRSPKRLRHYCGALRLGDRHIPVVGFPFLRTPSTHNSNAEVALLGSQVLQCIRAQRLSVPLGSAKDIKP